MSLWLAAVILGVVEGITEFLPISSTGHMIIVGHLLGWEGERAATFEVFIQLGAILAVVVLYRQRFLKLIPGTHAPGFSGWRGLTLLALTTLPALVAGALLHKTIKMYLFNPFTVALGLGIGGLAILLLERRTHRPHCLDLNVLKGREAFLIGLCQCLALWPGVSRAAATILGGMLVGVERKAATEYSFLAAVPVMCAAVGYDLLKSWSSLHASDVTIFALGFVVAFGAALAAVAWFIRLLSNHTLSPFGWYRLAVAAAVLVVLG